MAMLPSVTLLTFGRAQVNFAYALTSVMFAFALTIPTPLKTSPLMLCSMNPKTCSTRQLTFDFFRFDSFCASSRWLGFIIRACLI